MRDLKKEKYITTTQEADVELEALLKAAKSVLKYRKFEEAAGVIFNQCKDLIGAEAGYVALLNDEKEENEIVYLEPGRLVCTVPEGAPMPIRGFRGVVYESGAPEFENAFNNTEYVNLLPKGHVNLFNVMFAPLKIEGETKGLMGLANKEGGFTEKDKKIASAFAEFAAISLSNSYMLETITKSEKRYQDAYDRVNFYKNIFSHDIRNILTHLLTSIAILNQLSTKNLEMNNISQITSLMKDQILRGAHLVENVDKYSDIDQILEDFKPVDVMDVLNTVKRTIGEKFHDKILNISFEHKKQEEYLVKANEFLVDVFENLINNSIMHNENDQIEININIMKCEGDGKNYVKMEFIDNASGIPDDKKEFIFSDAPKENAIRGIGLSLVTKIIDSYKGKIWVENRLPEDYEKGSKFILLLPVFQ